MNHTDSTSILASAVTASVLAAGWSLSEGPSLALRTFDSAVGEKRAVLWLAPEREGEPNRSLTGEFWSEGRNVLSAERALIPVGASEETVKRISAAFLSSVDREIGQSYAVRLLNEHGHRSRRA